MNPANKINHCEPSRKEMLSGRLGDLLSMLFLTSMVLKHYEDQGCPADDLPIVEWACQYLLNRYQEALHEILLNFPNRFVALKLRCLVFPIGRHFHAPSDQLDRRVADLVTEDTAVRGRLIEGIYLTATKNNPLGFVNEVFLEAVGMTLIERKLKDAISAGKLDRLTGAELARAAEQEGIIDKEEAKRYVEYDNKLMEVINVDEFPYDAFVRTPTQGRKVVRKKTTRRKKTSVRKTTGKKKVSKKDPGITE